MIKSTRLKYSKYNNGALDCLYRTYNSRLGLCLPSGETKEIYSDEVKTPVEILARGPLYVQAYNKAIQEGMTPVGRVPMMIVGQARSGKTSLKKSLRRQLFNEKEESTDGIEQDPSYFSVTSEILTAGETDQEPDSDSEVSFHNRVAKCMVDKLKGETVNLDSSNQASVGSKEKSEDSDINRDTHAPAGYDISKQTEELNLDEDEIKEKDFKREVPEETAACLAKKLQESKREDEDKVYCTLWDFGGQSVYYAIHPIFLTPKAIYLLVYDVSKDLRERATPIVNEGVFKQKKDHHCTKTNEDYLRFWLSSVSSLESGNISHSDSSRYGKLPKRLPPVILVCTHADQCDDAREVAREIYGSLRKTTFGDHLYKKYFVVDNTKSGSADECPGVKHLKQELFTVAKQLPHMKQSIPIKWLSFEEALKNKIDNGEPFIVLDEARRVARDECGIDDDEQFDTLLKFLHDQRILIHFDDDKDAKTPKLNDMVILDPQWLVNLFRKVITVKSYDPTANDEQHEELWEKLETDGILDDKLLQIVWGPLLNNETIESFIMVMEKFTLLCLLPSVENQKQYLVPSMLMSYPDEAATKLLEANFIPPLFIRFKRPRPLGYPRGTTDETSIQEHVQVPLGLFPRLVIKFLQWCIKDGFRPVYENMYQNFVRFPIHPKGYSVILRCHSSFVEIVLYRGPDASDASDEIGYMVRDQLESMLQSLSNDCFWLNTMEWEFSVICPVCCKQRSVHYCHQKHHTSGCEKQECLHFWSESELQHEQYCVEDTFAEREAVPVEEFIPWLRFLKMQMQSRDEFGHSFGAVLPGHHPGTDEVYNMTARPRGLTLIININSFDDHHEHGKQSTRHGSEEDVRQIEALFHALGFEVHLKENLRRQHLLDELDSVACQDHSAYDCFVLFVMSHGMSGVVFCSDGVPLPIQSAQDLLCKCVTLRGKPKLLFIQACRGGEEDEGFAITTDRPSPPEDSRGHVDPPSDEENPSASRISPTLADFLYSYATVDGYVSYRRSDRGSFFVRALVDAFYKRAANDDLLSILTTVNRKVSKMVMTMPAQGSKSDIKNFKQMPEVKSTLLKQLRF